MTQNEMNALFVRIKEYIEPALEGVTQDIEKVVRVMRAEIDTKFKALEEREAAETKMLETIFHIRDK